MATDSQRCVDELLLKQNDVDKLICKFADAKEANSQDSADSKELIDQARELVKSVQLYIDNNKELIPSYCLKRTSDALRTLEGHIDRPKRKNVQFKFSSKPKNKPPQPESSNHKEMTKDEENKKAAVDVKKAQEVSEDKKEKKQIESLSYDDSSDSDDSSRHLSPEERRKPKRIQLVTDTYGFTNRKHQFLTLSAEQVKGRDISLVNLDRCNVVINGMADTIYIRNVWRSEITVCLATSSIQISDCFRCEMKLVCQQLRISLSASMIFHNFVTCRTMCESSEDLEFKCLDPSTLEPSLTLDQVKNLLVEADFDEIENNWKLIDDFDHLCKHTPSKNYMIIE